MSENNEQKEQKKESIFRKKSLERISSPEELDNYLTVTGPGVWFTLLTAVFLLIGALVWMAFGQIETTLGVAVSAGEQGVVCYVPYDHKESAVKTGTVRIGGQDYRLTDVGFASLVITDEMDANLRRVGSLSVGTVVAPLCVEGELMQGTYAGEIVVETLNPIKFIVN